MCRAKRHRASAALSLLVLLLSAWPFAPAAAADVDGAVSRWWNGNGATAPDEGPFGFLREHGVAFGGKYYGALFGIRSSQSGAASPWDEGAQLNLDTEPSRLLAIPELAGLVVTVQGRWRAEATSADPNAFVGGSSMFDPSNWASGTGWRLLQINASYARELDDARGAQLWLKAGWVQPRYEFALQPPADRFMNNALASAKGIGGNVPFSSSFSTWGGMGRLRTAETYAKAGLFMAYPDATESSNHGQQFGGAAPRNSAMGMAEVGWTPSLAGGRGDARPGKYVVGAWLYDNANGAKSSGGSANFGVQTGLYVQADQLLYREPDAPSAAEAAPAQGLTTFSLAMWAPPRNDQFQLYFHTGLDYTGAIPARDRDAIALAVAYGNYSRSTHSETILVEGGYHAAVSRWLDVYPFVQYEIRPAGTASVANALVVGFATTVTF